MTQGVLGYGQKGGEKEVEMRAKKIPELGSCKRRGTPPRVGHRFGPAGVGGVGTVLPLEAGVPSNQTSRTNDPWAIGTFPGARIRSCPGSGANYVCTINDMVRRLRLNTRELPRIAGFGPWFWASVTGRVTLFGLRLD